MIEHILKFVTLGTVIISAIAIYTALHTNNRRLGADIFLRYSDRISDLRERLPSNVFLDQEAPDNVMTPQERKATHEAIYSIFELYELKVHGFIPSAIWKIWEPDIEQLLSHSIFRQELAILKSKFARHPRFQTWLARIESAIF